jgi:signal transduction histidine kinase
MPSSSFHSFDTWLDLDMPVTYLNQRGDSNGSGAMAKTKIKVELDEETRGFLASVGRPADPLVQLADWAATHGRRVPGLVREETDDGIRFERGAVDRLLAEAPPLLDSPASIAYAERRRALIEAVHRRRELTDQCLKDERAHANHLQADQREANTQMVSATIRAQELQDAADLAMEDAKKTEQDLRSVAEFREMFIGILCHDLRTPLGSISMTAELLQRRGQLDDSQIDLVARISRSCDRIARMISQLLDLTRSRLGGGFPLDRTATDVRAIGKRVVDEFRAPITLDAEGELAVYWDADRMEEVLSNLVGNAIEYSADGTQVTVHVRADGDSVAIDVINQGQPIPPEVLPHIFEPFRRARAVVKSPGGNLGLGLYIAHEIVVSHGGTLRAHSDAGTTTFAVRLPRGLAPPAPRPTPSPAN